MSDLISRQDAIDAINNIMPTKEGFYEPCEVFEELMQLPSAQPERKTGKWIKGANHGLGVYTLTCDKCGYVDVSSSVINFCPNCGADMRGEQDERFD